jgi:K+-transporting ATPase ATPase C chain
LKNSIEKIGFFTQVATSGRIVVVSIAICCVFYALLILGLGQTLTPYTANGSLIRNKQDAIIGSELIAQRFSRPEYFWPRPSAVDYNASAAGGSNLSPTNPKLRARAEAIISKLRASVGNPIPADLATTSGSGLDPLITLAAAKHQAKRVASARGLSITTVMGLLEKYANRPGGPLTPQPVVNVLLVNMALDRLGK